MSGDIQRFGLCKISESSDMKSRFQICFNTCAAVLVLFSGISLKGVPDPSEVYDVPRLIGQIQELKEMRKLNTADPDRAYGFLDSLKHVALESKDDPLMAYVVAYQGFHEQDNNDREKARIYLQTALELAKAADMPALDSEIHRALGSLATLHADPSEALDNFQLAVISAEKAQAHRLAGAAYSLMGNVYRVLGDYNKAIEFTLEAADAYKRAPYDEGTAWVTYILGIIYRDLGIYDDAMEYFKSSLDLYTIIRDQDGSGLGVAICLDQIGYIHLERLEYQAAREHISKALAIYEELNNIHGLARATRNLGRVEMEQGNSEAAIAHAERALSIIDLKTDLPTKASIYTFMGRALFKAGQHASAMDTLKQALNIASRSGQRQLKRNIYKELAANYYAMGDMEKAFELFQKQAALADSLQSAALASRASDLTEIYEKEIRRKRIRKLEAQSQIQSLQLEKEKQSRELIMGSLFALIIILVGITFYLRLQRKTIQAKQASELKLKTMIQKLPVPIIQTDESHRFILVNEKFQEAYGYDLDDLANQDAWWQKAFKDSETRDRTRSIFQVSGILPLPHERFQLMTKSGEKRYSEIYLVTLDQGRLIVLLDVTNHVLAREAQQQMERELMQAQKLEALGVMVSGIAHEFNNILQGVSLTTELIQDELPDSTFIKSGFATIMDGLHREKEIIHSIQIFSRTRKIDLQEHRIQDMIEEVVSPLRLAIPANINVVRELDPSTGPIRCDREMFEHVLMNLFKNAVLAIGSEEGTLTLKLGHILTDPEAGGTQEMVELIVSDTGTGIQPDMLDRVFDPFYSTRETGTGTGLGLSVVHGIIQMLGGSITVVSEPGVLTSFTIRLPLAPVEAGG